MTQDERLLALLHGEALEPVGQVEREAAQLRRFYEQRVSDVNASNITMEQQAEALEAERAAHQAERERLRDLLRQNEVDPDAPIPPFPLHREREAHEETKRQLAEVCRDYEAAIDVANWRKLKKERDAAQAARYAALARVAKLSEDLEGVMRADDQVVAQAAHIETLREALLALREEWGCFCSACDCDKDEGPEESHTGYCIAATKALATTPTAGLMPCPDCHGSYSHKPNCQTCKSTGKIQASGLMEKVRGLAAAVQRFLDLHDGWKRRANIVPGPSLEAIELAACDDLKAIEAEREALTALYAIAPGLRAGGGS